MGKEHTFRLNRKSPGLPEACTRALRLPLAGKPRWRQSTKPLLVASSKVPQIVAGNGTGREHLIEDAPTGFNRGRGIGQRSQTCISLPLTSSCLHDCIRAYLLNYRRASLFRGVEVSSPWSEKRLMNYPSKEGCRLQAEFVGFRKTATRVEDWPGRQPGTAKRQSEHVNSFG